MDHYKKMWLKKAVCLAHSLAYIERALERAEQRQDFNALSDDIRREIAYAETVAGDDLDSSRRMLHGDVSQ